MVKENPVSSLKEYREITNDVDGLNNEIKSTLGPLPTNKNLFFREEIQVIRNKIVHLLEREAQNRSFLLEVLPELQKRAISLSDIENALPNLETALPGFFYYYKTSYKITDLNPEDVFNSLTVLDVSSKSVSKASKEELQYLEDFPFHNYVLMRNGYRVLFIDSNQDVIKNCIRQSQEWEPDITALMRKYIVSGSTVIDLGSHIGIHTLSMSLFAGDNGKVIAFEPQRKIFRELVMNLKINECRNVLAYHCALSDSAGMSEIQTPTMNEGGSSLGTGSEKALVIPLDILHLKNVSFIKMDVENLEDRVLKGAYQTIMSNRPIIILEIMARNEQHKIEKMIEIFNLLIFQLDYRMQFIGTHNYIAIPN